MIYVDGKAELRVVFEANDGGVAVLAVVRIAWTYLGPRRLANYKLLT